MTTEPEWLVVHANHLRYIEFLVRNGIERDVILERISQVREKSTPVHPSPYFKDDWINA